MTRPCWRPCLMPTPAPRSWWRGVRVWFCVAILSLATDTSSTASGELLPTLSPAPQRDAWWMARHERILADVRHRQIDLVFIGDSITQGWEDAGRRVWEEYYGTRHALNLGCNSDGTEHVLWRLAHGELDGLAPRVTVVLIGTNNIGIAVRTERAPGPEPSARASCFSCLWGCRQTTTRPTREIQWPHR